MPATNCNGPSPRTDGSTVVFQHGACGSTNTLYAWKDGVLRTLVAGQEQFAYDVAGGWIGAARLVGITPQAWRFDPAGTFATVTGLPPSTSEVRVDRAHANGDIAFLASGRWLTRASDPEARPAGSGLGRSVFIGNVLHVALGNTLFAYERMVPKASTLSLDFGVGSMGARSAAKSVVLANDSTSTVSISGVSVTAGYEHAHDCSSLAPGQTCTVQVRFTPPVKPIGMNQGFRHAGFLAIASSGNTQPIQVALAGFAQKTLVPHFYQSLLGRAPDNNGNAFWQSETGRVVTLGADLNEAWYALAMAFFASTEYGLVPRTNTAFVTNLYDTFLSRSPDSAGLSFWTAQLDAGLPRDVALASFMFSTEFAQFSRALFGGGPARAEVNMVMDFYRGLLGRLPDSAGFNHWVGQFRAAQCQDAAAVRAQVEAISSAFVGSGEYSARNRTNSLHVGDLYNAFLRRGGDLNGVQFWINQLNAGRPRDALRRDFIASPEFEARVQAVVAQGCAQ
jgi:hypothetical protein